MGRRVAAPGKPAPGRDFPWPIVQLDEARKRTLAHYALEKSA